MKHIVFLFLVFFLSTVVVGQGRGLGVEDRVLDLSELDLSPLQANKIEMLRVKYKDLFEHVVKSTAGREDMIEKRKSLQRDLRIEMKEILTPSQQLMLRELNQRKSKRNGSSLLDAIDWDDISESQRNQIKAHLDSQRVKVSELRAMDLPDQEKRMKFTEIKDESMGVLEGILTPEQYANFREKVGARKRRHEIH